MRTIRRHQTFYAFSDADLLHLVPLYLDGIAERWWTGHSKSYKKTSTLAQPVFDAFITHFRGPDFAARASNDLFNVSQQAEETVDTFALRFSDLLELAMET